MIAALILIPIGAALLGGLYSVLLKILPVLEGGGTVGEQGTDRLFFCIGLAACLMEFGLAVVLAYIRLKNGSGAAGLITDVREPFCGWNIGFTYDGFRLVYTVVLSFMWLMSMLFGVDYFRGHGKTGRYCFFNLLTLGGIMGVFLAADLMTALIFFEIMSFASFPWVIQEETDGAIRAANTYLAVAVIGGLSALMGLFLLQNELGTLELSALYEAAAACENKMVLYIAGFCILAGFGAKAGMFPLHIWLPKAHPVAPAPASALLSGALTKSGIWGIIVLCATIFRCDVFFGKAVLVFGVVTMVLGAVLALFSVDLKRTLACSSMSQIGFILIGAGLMGMLGEENALAARGAFLHMVNHSSFKLVLFLAAGCVYMNAHSLDLNEIRGFGRDKNFLKVCFLLGALGIAGVPGLNGYVSKTLLHEAIAEASAEYGPWLTAVEWIFLFSGGLTLAYMTKLFVCIFAEKKPAEPEADIKTVSAERTKKKKYMSAAGYTALGLSAAVIPVLGFTCNTSMNKIADLGASFFAAGPLEEAVRYYSPENLKGSVISILIGAAVYLFAVRKGLMREERYVDLWPKKLDLEELVYRPLLLKFLPGIFGSVMAVFAENRLTKVLYHGTVRVAAVASHVFCDLTDAVLLGLRMTVFKENPLPITDPVYHSLPYQLGLFVDKLRIRRHKEEEGGRQAAETYVRGWRTFETSTHNLADSISAALLLLCLAICGTLLYVFFLK